MRIDVNSAVPANDHICTGSLISRQHVLSASYCTLNRLWNETVVHAETNNLLVGRVYGIAWWIRYNEWCIYRQRANPFHDNEISITKVNYFLNKTKISYI
jgi:hypothetical protein